MKLGQLSTLGAKTAAHWLESLGLAATPRWYVEIVISTGPATRFELNMYAEEWGFAFRHDGRESWIRITDIPFVHGRDDFSLLTQASDPDDVPALIETLAQAHGVALPREKAEIRSNVDGAESVVPGWLAGPPTRPRRRTREL